MFTTILEETQPCFVECGTALVKEGKRILGRPRGSDIWVNFSDKLNKLINEWELHKEEYHLDVKISSDKNIEEIMHAICKLDNVEEVVRK